MKRPSLSESDREYYRRTWGFDPVVDARPSLFRYINAAWKQGDSLDDCFLPGDYRYYTEFPLQSDGILAAAGVRVRASVEVFGGDVHNAVIFCRGARRAEVACTHTVVYAGAPSEALTYAKDDYLQEPYGPEVAVLFSRAGGPVTLPPWEHFVALRSWVAAIAEMGIGNALRTALPIGNPVEYSIPFGFNAAMQAQFISALRKVASTAFRAFLRDFFLEMADNVPAEWLNDHFPFLDDRYGFCRAFFRDAETFAIVESRLDPRLWRDACAFMFLKPPPHVRAILMNRLDPDAVERGARISTPRLLRWCQEHPMSPISALPGSFCYAPLDITLVSPNQIFLEEWPTARGPPHVWTFMLVEFKGLFDETTWIINRLGWSHVGKGRRVGLPDPTPRGEWEDLRMIFDTARVTNRENFEEQMESLNEWCNLRALVTQDVHIYRTLVLMTRTPLLAIMAALYPQTDPEILRDIRASLREYDLGIEALAKIALKETPDPLGQCH